MSTPMFQSTIQPNKLRLKQYFPVGAENSLLLPFFRTVKLNVNYVKSFWQS